MKNEAKTGSRVEQGEKKEGCIAMLFIAFVLQVANLWCQKSDVIFLHNGIHNLSKFYFQKCIWIFSVGICIFETSAMVLKNVTIK